MLTQQRLRRGYPVCVLLPPPAGVHVMVEEKNMDRRVLKLTYSNWMRICWKICPYNLEPDLLLSHSLPYTGVAVVQTGAATVHLAAQAMTGTVTAGTAAR
jgi:hypothetical protein